MKRIFISFILVLVFALSGIALIKSLSSQGPVAVEDDMAMSEKENIRRFWQVYREATRQRVSGNVAMACKAYQEALALNARHEDALYYVGNMFLELNDARKAEQAWRKLLEINPASTRAHLQLGGLYLNYEKPEYFDLDRAEAEFKQALKINGEENGVLLRLGQSALLRGDLKLAAAYISDLAGSHYKNVEAHFIMGYIAWKGGDPLRSEQFFRQACNLARTGRPVKGELREKEAGAGMSPRTAHGTSPFVKMVADLSDVEVTEIEEQAAKRYDKLDSLLSNIRRKIF